MRIIIILLCLSLIAQIPIIKSYLHTNVDHLESFVRQLLYAEPTKAQAQKQQLIKQLSNTNTAAVTKTTAPPPTPEVSSFSSISEELKSQRPFQNNTGSGRY